MSSGEPAPTTTSPGAESPLPEINIQDVDAWEDPPKVSFDQQATYDIAKWILAIFATVYALCFIIGFFMLRFSDASFQGALEFIKFMVGSILPLVTLAVGYYLGDKNRANP